MLKAGAVNGPEFDPNENKRLADKEMPLPEFEIKTGDVLISRANTRELLGSAALVRKVQPRLLLCDKLYRLTIRKRTLNSELGATHVFLLGLPIMSCERLPSGKTGTTETQRHREANGPASPASSAPLCLCASVVEQPRRPPHPERNTGNGELRPSEFLRRFMRSTPGHFEFERDASGSSASMQNIGRQSVRNLWMPVPPLAEQAAIAAYLDEETAKLDALVGKVEAAVERLQE